METEITLARNILEVIEEEDGPDLWDRLEHIRGLCYEVLPGEEEREDDE